jgi:hypothetical protein
MTQPIQKQRLSKGSKATFAGVLLSDAALAKIKTDHDKAIKLLKLELEKAKREKAVDDKTSAAICNARIQSEQVKTDACTRDRERQRKIFTKALDSKKCPSSIWHYLSFVGGAVVAGGICIGADRGLR